MARLAALQDGSLWTRILFNIRRGKAAGWGPVAPLLPLSLQVFDVAGFVTNEGKDLLEGKVTEAKSAG